MLIVCGIDGDENDPMVVVTTPGGNVGSNIKVFVGVGKRYYAFASIPFDFSNGIVVNFTGAPTCDDDPATNNTAIVSMLETAPLDKISAP